MVINHDSLICNGLILLWMFKVIFAYANDFFDLFHNISLNKKYYTDHIPSEDMETIPKNVYETEQTHDVVDTENYTNSDYNHLVNEYHNDNMEVILSYSNITHTVNKKATNSSDDGQTSTSRKSFRWLHDVWVRRQKIVSRHLWKIMIVWFLIYLAVALPLWCTKGWCCCCLFCKFFKPTRTIEEAKRFVDANPPGVLQDNNGGIIFYDPTDNERECYEKFGHLIRTI